MSKVILVGERHRDPWKAEYAKSFIAAESPDAITHEHTHVERIMYRVIRLRVGKLLRYMGQPEAQIPSLVRAYMMRPFEDGIYRFSVDQICHEFAQSHKLALHYIGHPDTESLERLLAQYAGPINYNDAVCPSTTPPLPDRSCYDHFRTRLSLGRYSGVPNNQRVALRTPNGNLRDAFTAERILELIKAGKQRICHFCGLSHMLDDEQRETLYSILKDQCDVTRMAIDHHHGSSG